MKGDSSSPVSPESSYEMLKNSTGQDFGWNFEEWENWIKTNVQSQKLKIEQSGGLLEKYQLQKEYVDKYGKNVARNFSPKDRREMSVEEFRQLLEKNAQMLHEGEAK